MKGQMSLEYVFRIIILIVTVIVIIGLILNFSNDIKSAVDEFTCKFFPCSNEKNCPDKKTIEKNSFISQEISTYIQSCDSCYSSIPEGDQKDVVCYLLIGKTSPYFQADKTVILNTLSSGLRNRTEITSSFSSQIVKIEFKELGNKIVVSSP
ncbi:MAG: hypothetical protein V1944_00405 [Candidatus Aenigmatarchaeota archaeon]